MDCNAGQALSHHLQGVQHGGGVDEMHREGMAHGMHDTDMSEEAMMHGHGDGMEGAWAHDFAQYHDHPGHMHLHPNMAAAAMAWDEQFNQQEMEHQFAEAAHAQQVQSETTGDWLTQFDQRDGEEWVEDFTNEDVQTFGVEGEPIVSFEEKQKNSQFYDFLRKVRQGDIVLEDGNAAMTGETGNWAGEFQEGAAGDDMAAEFAEQDGHALDLLQQQWAEEAEEAEAWREEYGGHNEFADEYMEEGFTEEQMAEGQDWVNEYKEVLEKARQAKEVTEYVFADNNPYMYQDFPLEEGITLMNAGSLSDAVLAFEAEVQKNPENAEAWQILGTTQAENEKDVQAIAALNQARKLDPKNVATLQALAVSHTNEANYAQALDTMKQWLFANPSYSHLANVPQPSAAPMEDDFAQEFLFVSPSEHKNLLHLYDMAIDLCPSDPELHVQKGVLHHLNHDYDGAAEAFNTALVHRPDDAKLWNKLGATLANGNRSTDAISAYNKALDINPGFVRVHYNLGIAYSNLGQQEAAAKQFLRAIFMQQGGTATEPVPDGGDMGNNNHSRNTREMWDVLRMSFNLMERGDLVELTWKQDLPALLQSMGMGDML